MTNEPVMEHKRPEKLSVTHNEEEFKINTLWNKWQVYHEQEIGKLKSEHADEMRKKDEVINGYRKHGVWKGDMIPPENMGICGSCGVCHRIKSSSDAEISRLKEEIKQIHKDYGCELRDPCGTIWEYAEKLRIENERLKEQTRWRKYPEEKPEVGIKYIVRLKNGLTSYKRYLGECELPWGEVNFTVVKFFLPPQPTEEGE